MAHPLSFRKHVLENGLKDYWQPRREAWTYMYLTVLAGHRYEQAGSHHVAHLLEHLLFSGTEGHDYRREDFSLFKHWCRERGFTAFNAETSTDAIALFSSAPLVNVPALMDFCADLAMRPNLDCGIEKERSIIRQERDDAENARDRHQQRQIFASAFGDHLAALNGLWPEDDALDGLTYDKLRAHHAATFDPSRMSVILIGGGKIDDWLRHLEDSFRPVYRNFVPAEEPPIAPFAAPTESPIVSKIGHRKTTVSLDYHWFLPPKQYPSLGLAAMTLEELLTRQVREKMRAAYDIDVSVTPTRDYVQVTTSTSFAKRDLKRVRSAVERILGDRRAIMAQARPTVETWIFEKTILDMSAEESAAYAADIIALGLDPPSPTASIRKLKSVTPEIVADAVAEFLPLDRAVVSIFENE